MEKSEYDTILNESFNSSIQKLKLLQKECTSQEKYSEAEKIEIKISMLKEKQKRKNITVLKSYQRSERKSIDSTFKLELKDFSKKWDQKIKETKEFFMAQEDELLKKHKELYAKEQIKLENILNDLFKPSAQLLNMIKCKEKAVAAKKYREAQIITNEIAKTLEYEKKASIEQKQIKINKQLKAFQNQLDKEFYVLQKKHETELREISKIKETERNNIEKKVENICRELENAQNIEINVAKRLNVSSVGRKSPHNSTTFRSEYSTPQKLTKKKSYES